MQHNSSPVNGSHRGNTTLPASIMRFSICPLFPRGVARCKGGDRSGAVTPSEYMQRPLPNTDLLDYNILLEFIIVVQ